MLARLVGGALTLELPFALADLRQLFRKLCGCLCTVALCVFELVDAAFGVAGKLLDARVLGNDLGVTLDERGLFALELGDALAQRLLPPVELMSPGVQLLFALGDCARRLLQLVASDRARVRGRCRPRRARLRARRSRSGSGSATGSGSRLAAGRDDRLGASSTGFDLRDRDEVRTRLGASAACLRSIDERRPVPNPFSVSGGVT